MVHTAAKRTESQSQMAWVKGKKANQEDVFLDRSGTEWYEQEVEGI